jgi:hypothetical protein
MNRWLLPDAAQMRRQRASQPYWDRTGSRPRKQAVQKRKERGWRTSIQRAPADAGVGAIDRADQLAGEAAAEQKNRPNLNCRD